MQQTITINPTDAGDLRRAIELLEGQYLVTVGKPYRAAAVQDDTQPPADEKTDAKTEPKAEKPARAKKTETKPEPVKEEPKTEPAATPAVAAAAQDDDLDNFGGDDAAAEPPKELTHEDIRTAIKACLSKNSANRDAIAKVLAKYTPSKMVPDVPKAAIGAVVDAINAL